MVTLLILLRTIIIVHLAGHYNNNYNTECAQSSEPLRIDQAKLERESW